MLRLRGGGTVEEDLCWLEEEVEEQELVEDLVEELDGPTPLALEGFDC